MDECFALTRSPVVPGDARAFEELNRARLRDEWTLDMNRAQIHAVYERSSELVLGE